MKWGQEKVVFRKELGGRLVELRELALNRDIVDCVLLRDKCSLQRLVSSNMLLLRLNNGTHVLDIPWDSLFTMVYDRC